MDHPDLFTEPVACGVEIIRSRADADALEVTACLQDGSGRSLTSSYMSTRPRLSPSFIGSSYQSSIARSCRGVAAAGAPDSPTCGPTDHSVPPGWVILRQFVTVHGNATCRRQGSHTAIQPARPPKRFHVHAGLRKKNHVS